MDNIIYNRRLSSSSSETIEGKLCWACFGTEDDEFEGNGDWISPCKCRGSIRWVHQACVLQWVDEKLKENEDMQVCCPQCNTEYIIVYNEVNNFVQILNKIDKGAKLLCPYLAGGVFICTIYWSAATYGAITVMQVMGKEEAMAMMENTDPFLLILILPIIPLSLVLGKAIIWEEMLLLLVQQFTLRSPLLRTILPTFLSEPVIISANGDHLYPAYRPTTYLFSALCLPTTAIIVGNFLFDKSSFSGVQKTLLGGLVFIAVKGILRIYQRQTNANLEKNKKILNYPESDNEERH